MRSSSLLLETSCLRALPRLRVGAGAACGAGGSAWCTYAATSSGSPFTGSTALLRESHGCARSSIGACNTHRHRLRDGFAPPPLRDAAWIISGQHHNGAHYWRAHQAVGDGGEHLLLVLAPDEFDAQAALHSRGSTARECAGTRGGGSSRRTHSVREIARRAQVHQRLRRIHVLLVHRVHEGRCDAVLRARVRVRMHADHAHRARPLSRSSWRC
jgi:hypothetical protein